MKKGYRVLVIATAVLYVLSTMTNGFIGPIAYVLNTSSQDVWQYVFAGCAFLFTLLIARVVKQELINDYLAGALKTKIPELIGTIASGLVVTLGICLILSFVFGRNISALVATLAGSAALLGFALQGFILALFTGISLNLEQNFKVGDRIKVGEKTGDVVQITWRNTVIYTADRETIYIPNVSLLTTQLINLDQSDQSWRRCIKLVLDYDVSVETAERILTSAALSAHGVKHASPPLVRALNMTPDGVQYGVYFFIVHHRDFLLSDHAVIKSILESLRKAGIPVALHKQGNIDGLPPIQISNRSSDLFYLVQQVRIFKNLSNQQCERVSQLLIPHRVPAKGVLVQFGQRRHSLFIVAEGVLTRSAADAHDHVTQERFISTEFLGQQALFACLPISATVFAEVDSLIYELSSDALQKLLAEDPSLLELFARNLAMLRSTHNRSNANSVEPDPVNVDNLFNQYIGQIKANYKV